jgi:hypothetical protein
MSRRIWFHAPTKQLDQTTHWLKTNQPTQRTCRPHSSRSHPNHARPQSFHRIVTTKRPRPSPRRATTIRAAAPVRWSGSKLHNDAIKMENDTKGAAIIEPMQGFHPELNLDHEAQGAARQAERRNRQSASSTTHQNLPVAPPAILHDAALALS